MNKEAVIELFKKTLSNHNDIRTPAEQQVQLLVKQPGFCLFLLDIYSDYSVDISIRNLAALLLKNSIGNNWRKKDSLFTNEEKSIIKDRILVLLNNPNDNCRNGIDLLAVSVGVIARVEFPHNWQNLLSTLLESFEKSSNEQIKITSLKAIKFVVKELASRRFVVDRDFFNQFSRDLFKYFIAIWQDGVKKLIEIIVGGGQDIIKYQSFCIIVLYVAKILRRVVEYGYTDYQNTPEICQLFSDIFQILPEFMKYRTNILNPTILTLVDKFIYISQKTIIKAHNQNPLTFIKLLVPSLQYFTNQVCFYNPHDESKIEWNSTEDVQSVMTQSLNFLNQVIDCVAYQNNILDLDTDKKESLSDLSSRSSGNSNSPISIAQNSITSFFNQELLKVLLKSLVSNYLIINRSELERWEESPDEYIQELQVKGSSYELKPSSYDLFILLMRHFHEDSGQIVLSMLEYVTSPSYTSNLLALTNEQICLKESCYMTIGLGYYDLMDKCNFSKLFSTLLVRELECNDVRFKIIKRRILWLVGYWVGKIPDEYKDQLVRILLEFIRSDDLVIALTAMDSLKAYIEDYQFDHNSYQPHLQITLESIITLFTRTTDETSKSNLIACLSSIFNAFADNIKPYSLLIFQLFTKLWNGGAERPLVKGALIRAMTFFLQAMNSDPTDFYPLLVPIINYSISSENQDEKVYLMEDGLDLWFQTMVRVPSLSAGTPYQAELLDLFKHWFVIMSSTLESSEICFKVLDTYLLLGQVDFLRIHGQELSSVLYDVIGDIGVDSTELITKSIHRIIQVVPNPQDSVVTQMLEQTLQKILSLLLAGKEDNPVVLVEYCSIFSRIFTQHPLAFFQLLDAYPLELLDRDGEYEPIESKEMPKDKSQLYSQFFEIYFDLIDSTGSSDSRKLIAIGLSNLLTVPREEIYNCISQIITSVVGLRADISDIIQDDYCTDGTLLYETSGVQIHYDLLFKNDPLNTVNLSTYLFEKVQQCSNVFGADNFKKSIESIHPSILVLAFPPSSLPSNN